MSIMVTFSTLYLWISSTENVFRDFKITLSGISSDTLPTKVVIVASLTNFLLCSSTYRAFIDVRIPSSNSKVLEEIYGVPESISIEVITKTLERRKIMMLIEEPIGLT